MRTRKIPLRMCSGCMERKEKKQLVRIVKTPQNEIKLDLTGKIDGRGAYICKNADCFRIAVKAHRFDKVFSSPLPEETVKDIERELLENE